jgi:mRNA-degrading endonuclease RelE of RelBE toxin-antitoxin system
MQVTVSSECEKMCKKLPSDIVSLFTQQKEVLRISTKDPRLHIKKLKGEDDVYSFRITRAYRALFFFQSGSVIIIFAIGHRKDVYK